MDTNSLAWIDTSGQSSYVRPGSVLANHLPDFDFALSPNWDQHGAPALSSQVLKLAQTVVGSFAGQRFLVADRMGVSREAMVDWLRGMGAEAEGVRNSVAALRRRIIRYYGKCFQVNRKSSC